MSTVEQEALPYAVLRGIRRYAPAFQARIQRLVRAKMDSLAREGRYITVEEIGECASQAIFGAKICDPEMERVCLEAHSRGEFVYLEDWIDELKARRSASC